MAVCRWISAHDSVARCFGKDYGDPMGSPNTPSYFSSIEASHQNACGITVEGTRYCGYDGGNGLLNPPPDPLKKIALGYYHACGLRVRFEAGVLGLESKQQGSASQPHLASLRDIVSLSAEVIQLRNVLLSPCQQLWFPRHFVCGRAGSQLCRGVLLWWHFTPSSHKMPNVQLVAIGVARTGAVVLTLTGHNAVYWGGYGNLKTLIYAYWQRMWAWVCCNYQPQGVTSETSTCTTRTTTTPPSNTFQVLNGEIKHATVPTRPTCRSPNISWWGTLSFAGCKARCQAPWLCVQGCTWGRWQRRLQVCRTYHNDADGMCGRVSGTPGCTGIEHHRYGRCEFWTRPEGIQAWKYMEGYTCIGYVFTDVSQWSQCIVFLKRLDALAGACPGTHRWEPGLLLETFRQLGQASVPTVFSRCCTPPECVPQPLQMLPTFIPGMKKNASTTTDPACVKCHWS